VGEGFLATFAWLEFELEVGMCPSTCCSELFKLILSTECTSCVACVRSLGSIKNPGSAYWVCANCNCLVRSSKCSSGFMVRVTNCYSRLIFTLTTTFMKLLFLQSVNLFVEIWQRCISTRVVKTTYFGLARVPPRCSGSDSKGFPR
jgi:hypothetical protein